MTDLLEPMLVLLGLVWFLVGMKKVFAWQARKEAEAEVERIHAAWLALPVEERMRQIREALDNGDADLLSLELDRLGKTIADALTPAFRILAERMTEGGKAFGAIAESMKGPE